MLKGINRRIIEINKTNNDFFEKAILFVNSDKFEISEYVLSQQADLYLKELPKPQKRNIITKQGVFITLGILMFIGFTVLSIVLNF